MFSRDEEAVFIQNYIIGQLDFLNQAIHWQASQTDNLDHRLLLDTMADLIQENKKILPKFFALGLVYLYKHRYINILFENYDLVRLKPYPNQENIDGEDAPIVPLTIEHLKSYYSRGRPSKLPNQHAIIFYGKQLYRYNRNTEILTPIVQPTNNENLEKYQTLKDYLSKGFLHTLSPANKTQRQWIAACTPLPERYEQRTPNVAMISELLNNLNEDLKKNTEEYNSLRIIALQESIKAAVILVGGLALQNGMHMFMRHLIGHTIPLVKFVLVMQYVMLGGAVIVAVGLGIAFYYHWRYKAFQQLEEDIQRQINTYKEYITPDGASEIKHTSNRNISYFFHTHKDILEPLIHEAVTEFRI